MDEDDAVSIAPSDPDARDLHDQEKAQRIEHEDLSRLNKQVGCCLARIAVPIVI